MDKPDVVTDNSRAEILIGYHLWVDGTIEQMILDEPKTKQALFDETIDSLSTSAPKKILYLVYKGLLM